MLPTLYCKKNYATREVLCNMLVLKLEKKLSDKCNNLSILSYKKQIFIIGVKPFFLCFIHFALFKKLGIKIKKFH